MFGNVWTRTSYGLEILHQCGKKVKTKSQTKYWDVFTRLQSYRGKAGKGDFKYSKNMSECV